MSAAAISDPWATYLDHPSRMATRVALDVFKENGDRLADFEIGVVHYPRAVEAELDRLIAERDRTKRRTR